MEKEPSPLEKGARGIDYYFIAKKPTKKIAGF